MIASGAKGKQPPKKRKERVFKVMGERAGVQLKPIPLAVLWEHERTAYRNHGQSFEQLDRRGGLTPKEVLHILYDLGWGENIESRRIMLLSNQDAELEMRELVRSRYRKMRRIEEEQAEIEYRRTNCNHPHQPAELGDGVRRCPKCGGWVRAGSEDDVALKNN